MENLNNTNIIQKKMIIEKEKEKENINTKEILQSKRNKNKN